MVSFVNSLNGALHSELAKDPRVLMLGEDVLDPYGGAFKVTKGLSTAFPGRVITTPISEAGFTGLASGLALRGFRPVVEIMFGDFLTLTFDQVLNHMAKFPTMYGKPLDVPVVIRTPMGGGRGYGATHSQSIEKHYLGIPGLRVVAPSHMHDPGELLGRAISGTKGPLLFLEHKMLYPLEVGKDSTSLQHEQIDDGEFPTVIVKNFSGGRPDCGVIAYGGLSRFLVPIAEALGQEEIKLAVALVSSLDPLPLATLTDFAKYCGKLLIAEEGTRGFNWGSEVSAALYESCAGIRLRRLSSLPEVIPTASSGEARVLVSRDQIESAIMELIE